MDKIIIKGANEHNLKNVNLELPRNKMIVFTGLSGSGKSSLAFDTIYNEGQRRYVESLSSYARQFLGKLKKPNVEYIEGLSPAISIDQKSTSNNPRSTVGTVTEIYDYFRLLYANIGVPHCPICKREIKKTTISEIIEKIANFKEKTKIKIIAPIIKEKKGSHKKLIEKIKKDGYVRLKIDNEEYNLFDDDIELDKNKKHTIGIIIDRLIIKENIEKRLADSVETAINLGEGLLVIEVLDSENISDDLKSLLDLNNEILFSTRFSCPEHNISIPNLTAPMFSFNNPLGACKECSGLGYINHIDVDLIVNDENLSLREGALAGFNMEEGGYYFKLIEALCKSEKVSMDTPYKDLSQDFKEKLLYGTDKIITFDFTSMYGGNKKYKAPFEGIVNNLERRFNESPSKQVKEKIGEFMAQEECKLCKGGRLNEIILNVTVRDLNIHQATEKSIDDLIDFIDNLNLNEKEELIAGEIIREIKKRLGFLKNVGLNYLTLSRRANTLSGGEMQRIRLASQIGSFLVGVLYVLDEPSIGLHQKDNDQLIRTMVDLKNIGNTLIVVEHDLDTIKAADYIVDIGPNAGIYGGEIVAKGTIEDIKKEERSITGMYLSGKRKIQIPEKRRKGNGKFIEIISASENNLKNINVKIPLGTFTLVTGVSGSGKSTLINDILYKVVSSKLYSKKKNIGKFKEIKGIENIDKIINIDQSPIGRTPRSNPATYIGVFDDIREVFAMTKEANSRGYKKGRFSFNVKGGRCENCKGDGTIKLEMQFLPDVYIPCEICNGKRYNKETLEITYKDKNISQVLDMEVGEALIFFDSIPKIKRKLQTLVDVGLSYIKLGQSSLSLSGGEAQRVKLASELSKQNTGKTLYILDEPTSGLHFEDINKLIKVLEKLTDLGNTIVTIEHNLDVIKCADYIIDLGPLGGKNGGKIVAKGTPEEVMKNKNSYTGMYLKKYVEEENNI